MQGDFLGKLGKVSFLFGAFLSVYAFLALLQGIFRLYGTDMGFRDSRGNKEACLTVGNEEISNSGVIWAVVLRWGMKKPQIVGEKEAPSYGGK